jgi:protein TIF31
VDYSIFETEAQNQESIQDLKMILNESVSGYWLGPYSLRLPRETKGSDDKVERTAEDGMPKEGQTLSEYLELGEVFGTNEQPRVLEVAKGECICLV